jgi:hypothetical protein
MPEITNPQPTEGENILRWLTDVYFQLQKVRIGMGNRVWAASEGVDSTNSVATVFRKQLFDQIESSEKLVAAQMEEALIGHPAWGFLQQVKGVGPGLATQLLGLIDDINKSPSISSLWRFAGYGVNEEGEAERLKKGEVAHFNKRLKVVVWKIGTSFLKCNSPYRRIYDEAKTYYTANRPDWTPMRIHRAAMRKMNKIFLQHLWVKWREAEGLPISKPWVLEHGGHVHYISAEDIIGGS